MTANLTTLSACLHISIHSEICALPLVIVLIDYIYFEYEPSTPYVEQIFDLLLLLTLISRKDHEKAEFEVHEVYAVDVLISTGEGKVSVLSLLSK